MSPVVAAGSTGPRARRGRPRRIAPDSALAPREEILREAARLFSDRGVGATRLTDIAAAVGITTPAIYYHFANLDAIVDTLLSYVVEESAAFATAAARREGPCAERLASLVAQHVERLASGPYDLWFVVGLSAEEARRSAAVTRKATEWRRAVARVVAEGVETGEFRPVDRRVAVAAVSGLVYAALQMRHRDGSVDAAEFARLAVAALGP